jgi:hypothetical protein
MLDVIRLKVQPILQMIRQTGDVDARGTFLGSLAVSQTEGERDEGRRGGLAYNLATSAATGIAPVQALPTTAAHWLLYMPPGNTFAFVDWIGMYLVSGVAGAGGTIIAAQCGTANVPTTSPTNAANIVYTNGNGQSSRAGKLICASSQTLVGTTGYWHPIAFMNPSDTLLLQARMEQRDIRGGYCIAPGCGLALVTISPTGTSPLFAPYAGIREYATSAD